MSTGTTTTLASHNTRARTEPVECIMIIGGVVRCIITFSAFVVALMLKQNRCECGVVQFAEG